MLNLSKAPPVKVFSMLRDPPPLTRQKNPSSPLDPHLVWAPAPPCGKSPTQIKVKRILFLKIFWKRKSSWAVMIPPCWKVFGIRLILKKKLWILNLLDRIQKMSFFCWTLWIFFLRNHLLFLWPL